jgi:tellurite resistance protein
MACAVDIQGLKECPMTLESRSPYDVSSHAPSAIPPPEFPPRRPALFAGRLRRSFRRSWGCWVWRWPCGWPGRLGIDPGPGDLLAGVAVALWGFAALAYGVKLARRPGVVVEDLRVMPSRSGLAALTMGGMVRRAGRSAYSPRLAMTLLLVLRFWRDMGCWRS